MSSATLGTHYDVVAAFPKTLTSANYSQMSSVETIFTLKPNKGGLHVIICSSPCVVTTPVFPHSVSPTKTSVLVSLSPYYVDLLVIFTLLT